MGNFPRWVETDTLHLHKHVSLAERGVYLGWVSHGVGNVTVRTRMGSPAATLIKHGELPCTPICK